ncbi:hypothetical protein CEXT_505581 [Caerostris extrusa]|uniref:Uncharacterized protein n=1 Tax=Caerostris extrusa TaxID=172846 RepID=A0AAV4X3A2_CAEEX|nr:hypothetical protein CEXT_505581 [Caerostris extrusa]
MARTSKGTQFLYVREWHHKKCTQLQVNRYRLIRTGWNETDLSQSHDQQGSTDLYLIENQWHEISKASNKQDFIQVVIASKKPEHYLGVNELPPFVLGSRRNKIPPPEGVLSAFGGCVAVALVLNRGEGIMMRVKKRELGAQKEQFEDS